jgi:hypothetical protein
MTSAPLTRPGVGSANLYYPERAPMPNGPPNRNAKTAWPKSFDTYSQTWKVAVTDQNSLPRLTDRHPFPSTCSRGTSRQPRRKKSKISMSYKWSVHDSIRLGSRE